MGDKNICEIDIKFYTIYSPNIQDSEIIIDVRLGQLVILFDPMTINKIVKLFRNTKSSSLKDVERFIINLMNN